MNSLAGALTMEWDSKFECVGLEGSWSDLKGYENLLPSSGGKDLEHKFSKSSWINTFLSDLARENSQNFIYYTNTLFAESRPNILSVKVE